LSTYFFIFSKKVIVLLSCIGQKINIQIEGESHGDYLKGIISGLPKGEAIDEDYIAVQMARRAPGKDATSTPRREADKVEFIGGLKNGFTTGEPLEFIIRNTNTHSSDYDDLKYTPRPSHADYPAFVKYKGEADMRGSGHFSGRLTAPLTAMGAICRQILSRRGIAVGGHVLNIGEVFDIGFDPVTVSEKQLNELSLKYFATISDEAQTEMREVILETGKNGDSIGGCVEIAVTGMPVGIGNHMFGGVENVVSSVVYGVPAVKGVSFGAGFDFGYLLGSEANDPYYFDGKKVVTATNNCGGIVGGMTTGMPVIIKAALKPTPSIFKEQNTVNLQTNENVMLSIKGRHDPCIVPRALPAVEAAVAVAITMLLANDNAL